LVLDDLWRDELVGRAQVALCEYFREEPGESLHAHDRPFMQVVPMVW
jgi:hypothetical protein